MNPNFIIGGVQKSGTTFLTSLLVNHPEVHIIKRDMAHAYFDDDRVFKKGEDWYRSLFKESETLDKNIIVGQTSADCAFNPNSVQRIMDYNPETKLIFVLRHPVDRAYSLYWHQYGMGREFRRFEQAIEKEPELIKKSYHNFKHYSYLERSRYKKQFENILELVPQENLLILDFESLIKETQESINVVLDFLKVSNIMDLEELNYSELPRNPALIPSSHFVVQVSAALQKIGLTPIGRRLVHAFREEKRPPQMNSETRAQLTKELADDIKFYETVRTNFQTKIQALKNEKY